jgi:peptidyl-prolyl cis-trans isomerase C
MLKIAKLGAIAGACVMLAAPAFAEDKIAAKVNDVSIPEARIAAQIKEAGYPDSPELRGQVLARTIQLELLAQEAAKKGIDKDPQTAEMITQMEVLARQNVLASAFIKDYMMNHPVSEDALRKEYDSIKSDPRMAQYNIARIVVKSEQEAKAIASKLKHGGNFAAIAKAQSMDKASGENGGDVGWISANGLQPDFAKAISGLKKKGQTSGPVHTGDVWQVLKLIDTRVTPYEDAKPMLMRPLQNAEVQKLLEDLRTKAKIEEVKK